MNRRVAYAVGALTMCAAVSSAFAAPELIPVEVSAKNRIAQVVEALNQRAEFTPGPWLGEDGTLGRNEGPVAWTVVNGGGVDPAACSINVAVLGAAVAAQVQDVVISLTGDPRIASATGIVITGVTPSVAEMQAFDAILVFTNSTPQNAVTLGSNMADYVDSGGGVVLTMFGIRASLIERTYQGRFLSDNYYCVAHSVGASTTGAATLGTVHVPGSPIMAGVSTFNGGTSSFRSPAGLHPLATRIADWSTGHILVAERTDLNGGRVDLNFFAVSQDQSSTSWLRSTDGALMLRNAVVVASRCDSECRADWNGDGQVDFFDYLDFVADFANDDADYNGDGQTDFFDYLDFVQDFAEGCD